MTVRASPQTRPYLRLGGGFVQQRNKGVRRGRKRFRSAANIHGYRGKRQTGGGKMNRIRGSAIGGRGVYPLLAALQKRFGLFFPKNGRSREHRQRNSRRRLDLVSESRFVRRREHPSLRNGRLRIVCPRNMPRIHEKDRFPHGLLVDRGLHWKASFQAEIGGNRPFPHVRKACGHTRDRGKRGKDRQRILFGLVLVNRVGLGCGEPGFERETPTQRFRDVNRRRRHGGKRGGQVRAT